MNIQRKTNKSEGALVTQRWLRHTARNARLLNGLIKTFTPIYLVFLITAIASYWVPLTLLLTCLGIVLCPLFLTSSIVGISMAWRSYHVKAILPVIHANNNVDNIGAVASIARFPLPHSYRLLVAAIVEQSLPMLTVPVLRNLSIGDRQSLYEFMVSADPTICQAILSVCEQAHDALALPFVYRVIRRYRSRHESDVLAQAIHCLEILKTYGMENQSHSLLRAANRSTDTKLLRPVVDNESASEELLRSSSGNSPAPSDCKRK